MARFEASILLFPDTQLAIFRPQIPKFRAIERGSFRGPILWAETGWVWLSGGHLYHVVEFEDVSVNILCAHQKGRI